MHRFPSPNDIWRSFARVFSPEVDFLWFLAVILGAVVLGVLADAIYDLARDPNSPGMLEVAFVLAALLLLIFGLIVLRFYRLRRPGGELIVESSPSPHRGLVWLLSLSPQLDHALAALRYHAGGRDAADPLYCWVLYTAGDTNLEGNYKRLTQQVNTLGLRVDWHPVHLKPHPDTGKAGAETVFEAVKNIYANQLPMGLDPSDVIVDITGGTRPIAAGALMACYSPRRHVEYVDSVYDPHTNQPIPGRQRIIEVKWQ